MFAAARAARLARPLPAPLLRPLVPPRIAAAAGAPTAAAAKSLSTSTSAWTSGARTIASVAGDPAPAAAHSAPPPPPPSTAAATATATRGSPPPGPNPTTEATAADSDLDASFVGMTGGQIVHEMLRKHRVRHVFGYPGGAILPVFDAIYESPHFEFILPRHEQGAGHMAEGYARATGRPGVVIVTSGPGATNVVTPLQDALSDGTPMVVFTGQVPNAAIGTDAFQEADIIGITRACTKWNVMVKDVADLPRRITEAFTIATSGRPGPVLVDLPKDVTAGVLRKAIQRVPDVPRFPGRPPNFLSPHFTSPTSSAPSPGLAATVRRVAAAVNGAQRPVIYAGQGILSSPHGPKLLKELSEKAQIPVTTTLQALGGYDERSPLALHMLGMHGSAYANLAMQRADVILALGARFDDRVTGNLAKFAPAARAAEADGKGGIFHFEIMPKNINKTVTCTEAVEGDVVANLRHLLAQVEERAPDHPQRAAWLADVAAWKRDYPFRYEANVDGEPMRPQYVVDTLNRMTRDIKQDVVITTGVGQHQMFAAQFYRWTHPRTFITSGGLGTMGYGLPAAIGAKVALGEDKVVIDIDGDASYMMTAMELMTASQYKIGVKVLLLNNDFQGMVKQWQDLFYEERYAGTPMVNPDFVKFAESFGVKGLRATTPEELEVAMREFIDYNDGPVVLKARVCKRAHVYPMVPAGKALDEMVLGPPRATGPMASAAFD
ncbi:Acetolactate synthase, mitochondrial [Blastocladiella emersonii ATCC 22665]|nr:Acetolactate synthase, mitochondrial [Blastocladiella emersonii ATCC 22665]